MRKNRIYFSLCALLLVICSFTTAAFAQNIIPKPQKAQMNEGAFNINSRTRVVVADNNPLFMEIAQDFAQTINTSTGYNVQVENGAPCSENTIVLKKTDGLEKEAYKLTVTPKTITISATEPNGLFY